MFFWRLDRQQPYAPERLDPDQDDLKARRGEQPQRMRDGGVRHRGRQAENARHYTVFPGKSRLDAVNYQRRLALTLAAETTMPKTITVGVITQAQGAHLDSYFTAL